MPYYIYSITTDEKSSSKQLGYISEHENFKAAKLEVRSIRASLQADEDIEYRIMFAGNQPEAEQRLLENREQPIVKEWEK